MDIEIKKLTKKDVGLFSELINIFKNEFEWNNFSLPHPLHLKKILNNKNFIVFISIKDYKVVGGLTAYILDRYDSDKPSVYIYDIAVVKHLQRNGIGIRLITSLNNYCIENKYSEVFVQAEMDDIQAVNFYRKTPISNEMPALHFTYTFENDK